jgi:hypothetical protein
MYRSPIRRVKWMASRIVLGSFSMVHPFPKLFSEENVSRIGGNSKPQITVQSESKRVNVDSDLSL